ncbi:hypothetical protein GCM10027048_28930 [Hymenobacter coalescens]
MRIDELEQHDSDIDWFAVDRDGYVVYFASGGGLLPESAAASAEALLQLHHYFLTLPETPGAAQVQVEPNAARNGRNAQGFVRYARRGLFAFDKTRLNEPRDTQYHLVARPAQPLLAAALPGPLAALLLRTEVPLAVATATQVDTVHIT